MPAANAEGAEPMTQLPFPPLTRSHILNCSYHAWYPKYRRFTPKARLIALSPAFVDYLRSDGILLPPDQPKSKKTITPLTPPASELESEESDWDNDDDEDPSEEWPEVHLKLQDTIKELGGSVYPKLNWSAPKDATWISATNNMECRTANDVYLLLKSSDFVSHDLEQVWRGCEDDEEVSKTGDHFGAGDRAGIDVHAKANEMKSPDIPYHLVLRKTVSAYNPALEFRCFVRARQLLGVCQRDLNYFGFLHDLRPKLANLIHEFYQETLQRSFSDSSFAFDVYIPTPYNRVWLIDINPWDVRTDPLLFSWLELLTMAGPEQRMATMLQASLDAEEDEQEDQQKVKDVDDDEDEDVEELYTCELRLVGRNDPEAYTFNTPKYSAHKLPKDVVDAGSAGGEGLREFLSTWREIEKKQAAEDASG